MITRSNVIDEWVYCNYSYDDDSVLTTESMPENIMDNIITYSNTLFNNYKSNSEYSKMNESELISLSILEAFTKYLPDKGELALVLDEAYANINIICNKS